MTATDEATVALARDEAAVTLARETTAMVGDVGQLVDALAEWADDAIAGGKPPKPVAYKLIAACRLIAAATRGEAAAP